MASRSMTGMFLVYRPPRRKNEHILGYIYRAMNLGGHVRMKDLATTLVDRQTIQPPWTVASNLRRLAEELAPVFVDAETILADHTCLPAHLPFVANKWREPLMAHVLDGKKHPGIAASVGLTGRAIVTMPRMAVCAACMREDKLEHGFPFWHREHAVAGIGYCPHHRIPLLVGCGACRFSQKDGRTPLMPRPRCWCGGQLGFVHPPVSPLEGEVLSRMSVYARELLDGRLEGRTAEAIGAYFHYCAHQAGFADGTRIKSPALGQALASSYSQDVLRRMNAEIDGTGGWLALVMGPSQAPNVLGRNLLLFDFFGKRLPDEEDFAKAEAHRAAMAEMRQKNRQHLGSTGNAVQRGADREEVLLYLRDHPGAGRTELLTALGRTIVRVRTCDAEWYDDLVPSAVGERWPDHEKGSSGYWKDFDERTSAHVYARAKELRNFPGGYPKSISKAALLKGTPRANEISERLLQTLPMTRQALKLSIESTKTFKVRYAIAILNQPEREGVDRVRDAQSRTGLPLVEVHKLNFTITAREAS